jgi:endonuclease YncB( thermonuclease family)
MSADQLLLADPNKYPLYTLENVQTLGKYCDNYDGDTADFLLLIDTKIQKHRVRMMGYDSPEMKPALKDERRDEKKKAAVAAKIRLAELCKDKLLYVKCHGADKYGRQLVTLYSAATYTGSNVNQQMIDEGHGYPYYGGKKAD